MRRLLGLVAGLLMTLIATGCATSHSTLVRPDLGGGQVIYRISEEKAFTTALEAYAVFLPKQSVDDIAARGFDRDVVTRVQRLLYSAEYKRRQAPPGVKITRKSFGRDRRYPLTNSFREP